MLTHLKKIFNTFKFLHLEILKDKDTNRKTAGTLPPFCHIRTLTTRGRMQQCFVVKLRGQ